MIENSARLVRRYLSASKRRLSDRMSKSNTSLSAALERLRSKELQVSSFLNLGAGAGDDLPAYLGVWPSMASLHIDMDPRFEGGYQRLQQAHDGVTYEICAVGSFDGGGRFTKSNSVGGALTKNDNAGASEHTHETKVARLDTLVEEHGLEGPFFIKFDTHGVELDILAGAEKTLKNTSLIMMEVYNFKLNFVERKNLTFDEMSLHLKGLGFRVVDVCDPLHRPSDGALWQMHMFFVRDDHPVWGSNSYSGK